MSSRITSLAGAAVLALAAFTFAPLAGTAHAACVTGVASNDVLNMRSRASARSAIVRGIPPHACGVTLTGRYSGNWGRVRYGGVTGWVNMRYIDEGGDGGGPTPVGYCVHSPGDGFLNFREGPSARHPIVGSANHGFCGLTVRRCSASGRWCEMRTHEFDGWVNMRYVREQ